MLVHFGHSMLIPFGHRELFETLHDAPFRFHLTGSRYFPTRFREWADWDFFVEDSSEVREFLLNEGFTFRHWEEDPGSYSDTQIAGLAEYQGAFIDVDVQLVLDVRLKELAQYLLRHFPPNQDFVFSHETWQRAYAVVETILGHKKW